MKEKVKWRGQRVEIAPKCIAKWTFSTRSSNTWIFSLKSELCRECKRRVELEWLKWHFIMHVERVRTYSWSMCEREGFRKLFKVQPKKPFVLQVFENRVTAVFRISDSLYFCTCLQMIIFLFLLFFNRVSFVRKTRLMRQILAMWNSPYLFSLSAFSDILGEWRNYRDVFTRWK